MWILNIVHIILQNKKKEASKIIYSILLYCNENNIETIIPRGMLVLLEYIGMGNVENSIPKVEEIER